MSIKRRLPGRPKAHSKATVVLVLLCCGLGVFLLSTSMLGDYISSKWIAPAFSGLFPDKATAEPTAAPAMAQSTEAPTAEASISFEIEESSWYLLQMGSYDDPEEAYKQALAIQEMGAGGYILTDDLGYSRVLASGYSDQDSLTQVQSQIRDAGFACSAYNLHLDGIRFTVKGEKSDAENLKKAISTATAVPTQLTAYTLSFDKSGYPIDEAQKYLEDLYLQLSAQDSVLLAISNRTDVTALRSYLGEIMTNISTFLQKDDTMSAAECSSGLKYLQLNTIMQYKKMIEELSSSSP